MGLQRPNLTILDLFFLQKVIVQMDSGDDFFCLHFHFFWVSVGPFLEGSALFQNWGLNVGETLYLNFCISVQCL